MTETQSSSAANSETGVSGGEKGSGTLIVVVLVVGLVVIGGVVVATSGLPGGDGSTPANETEQNSTDNEQRESDQENASAESFDPAALETSSQAPTKLHTDVLWSNETDAGYAADHTARMTGLNNHAALMADDFEEAGLDVASSEGQLASTQYRDVESDGAYGNYSTVTVTVDEETEAFKEALDLSARAASDSALQGSPPGTYTNASGEALQPDYVVVRFRLTDGRMVAGMPIKVEHIRAFQNGELTPTEYAGASIGRLTPPSPRWNTGDVAFELPEATPKEILSPQGLFTFEERATQLRVNYTEYDPARYEVTPNYYKDNARTGFGVDIYLDENESLETTLPMSAYVLGQTSRQAVSEMRGGNGFAFIDATYYNSDGEKLGEVQYDPLTTIQFANANRSASEYASMDGTYASFNATHPDAERIEDANMTRLTRAGQLRLWASQYERLFQENYNEAQINSTQIDVETERILVHTYVPEWPEESSSPAALDTHPTDITRLLIGFDPTTEWEPEEGVFIYQENGVRNTGDHRVRRTDRVMYADADDARNATAEGAESHEAYQWAAEASWTVQYFFHGYEPANTTEAFSKTYQEWYDSNRTFDDPQAEPPDEE